MKKIISSFVLLLAFSTTAMANSCDLLPDHQALNKALKSVIKPTGNEANGGLELNMWATLVSRDGTVCSVARSGDNVGDQWPGSRVISAQKANTANAFSLPGLALSTANLWTATQPGGSLFGLQFSNPVDTDVAYRGKAKKYGTAKDPMRGDRIGGVNVFGGGLALYNSEGEIVGALGVSGDTSCADHNVAWKTRDALKLDYVPGGVSATGDDNIIYQQGNGFAHPECGGSEAEIAGALPTTHPISTQ
jgi:uncharacterized protein GlcG (DUF336 family)